MTTLAQLADSIQTAVSDTSAATWSQATIETWLNEVISEYFAHFPVTQTELIVTNNGNTDYDLPAGTTAVLSAMYLESDNGTETYLTRLSFADGRFSRGYYDILATLPPKLRLGHAPPGNDEITLLYQGTTSDITSSQSIIVPPNHFHILRQGVTWRAAQERLMNEDKNAYRNLDLLTALAQTAASARDLFETMIVSAKAQQAGQAAMVKWDLDGQERIY